MPNKSYPLSRKHLFINQNKLVLVHFTEEKQPSVCSLCCRGHRHICPTKGKGGDFWEMPQMRIKSLHIAKRPLPTRYLLYTCHYQNRCHNYNKKHEGFTEAMGLYAVQGRTSISLPFRYLVLTQLNVISSLHPGQFHTWTSSKCQGIKGDFCQSPLRFSTTPQISHKAPPNTSLCRS